MFGRRKNDEDPFAALQDSGTYHSEPTTLAATATTTEWSGDAASTPVAIPTAAPSSPTPRRRRSSRPSIGWLAWFLVPLGLAVIVTVVVLVGSVGHSTNVGSVPIVTSTPTQPTGTSTAGGSHAAPKPAPVDYLTATGMRTELARVAHLTPGGKVLELRINAKSFDAIVQLPNHSVKLVSITPGTTFSASAGPTGERPLRYSMINPAVPGRLVAELQRRFHVPLSRIDYVVAFWFPNYMPEWQVFVKGPSHPAYLATLAGAQLHRSP